MDAVIRIASADLGDPTALRGLLDVAFDGGFRDADWHHALGGWHFLVEDSGQPIAHAAVIERTLVLGDWKVLAAYVESVATHPDHRGRGLGSAVMRSVGALIEKHYGLGGLSAGIPTFYEPFGWQRWRGLTYVQKGEERLRTPDDDGTVMVLPTSNSLAFDVSGPIVCTWRAGEVW